ncbi:MAG: SMC-Scp complex subunit ScpB, partial [Deltaproteobacteria bacterium]|nr:SMC-Scp complex subunit ScpB [Deltaproteobacteria bacterium]
MKKRKNRQNQAVAAPASEAAAEVAAQVDSTGDAAAENATSATDAPETTTQDPIELADPSVVSDPAAELDFSAPDDGAPAEEIAAAASGEELSEESEPLPAVEGSRLESIIESLLFAADRPLIVNELKRMLGERDGKRVTEALENLRAQHAESGIQLVSVAGGWQLRTHPGNGAWVAKLVAGRPTRLSRAMMETLAIVAYRQPITRPEIDEIRGVDCGPVLRTLLDRALIRVIGKKEEVGRPILYGTTPEFLKVFSLKDLADLPTLREFHELGADDRAKVDATAAGDGMSLPEGLPLGAGTFAGEIPRAGELPDVDPEEEDSLIE